MVQTCDGWISPHDLEQGCQLRVQHDIDITGGRHSAVMTRLTDKVWYGRFTGVGYAPAAPEVHDIRLFENGMWMWDGERWFNIDDCRIALIPPVFAEGEVPFSDIPFCDFDNILEEEMEASECL